MDYEEYGGALLLGVKAPVIKCHGASKEKSVYYGIMQAAKCIKSGMVETISESIIDAKM
jgi:glycerol-3-phosphate acyltransferase PlsX